MDGDTWKVTCLQLVSAFRGHLYGEWVCYLLLISSSRRTFSLLTWLRKFLPLPFLSLPFTLTHSLSSFSWWRTTIPIMIRNPSSTLHYVLLQLLAWPEQLTENIIRGVWDWVWIVEKLKEWKRGGTVGTSHVSLPFSPWISENNDVNEFSLVLSAWAIDQRRIRLKSHLVNFCCYDSMNFWCWWR